MAPHKDEASLSADLPVGNVVARNFIRFREEVSLRQNQAANLAEITLSALTKIEQGLVGIPRASTINRFAALYGRKFEHFFMQKPPPVDEEASLKVPVWSVKGLPGFKPDPDLEERLRDRLKELTLEQRRRWEVRLAEGSEPPATESKTNRRRGAPAEPEPSLVEPEVGGQDLPREPPEELGV